MAPETLHLVGARPKGSLGLSRRDPRYWEGQLILRPHTELARPNSSREFFVRIDFNDEWAFFPLNSSERRIAAKNARDIYSTALHAGWSAVCRKFVREITVGIFWLRNPLAVTYATLFTRLQRTEPSITKTERTSLLIIEPEKEVRWAIVHWLTQIPGFDCVVSDRQPRSDLTVNASDKQRLILSNAHSRDTSNEEFGCHLQDQLSKTNGFCYRVYRDSDELFVTVHGVDKGYFLRRRAPTALLEPLRPFPSEKCGSLFSANYLHSRIQAYFRNLIPPYDCSRPQIPDFQPLTAREIAVMKCINRGLADKQIAQELSISPFTVNDHLKHIYRKLDEHSRSGALGKFLDREK